MTDLETVDMKERKVVEAEGIGVFFHQRNLC